MHYRPATRFRPVPQASISALYRTLALVFCFFSLLVAPEGARGQDVLDLDLSHTCSYFEEVDVREFEEVDVREVYSFASSGEAEGVIENIVDAVGLESNFEVRAASVANASAVIDNGKRWILYSQNFLLNVRQQTGSEWAATSILAHEIGHHLNGHSLDERGSRPKIELEADKFSGFVLAKMGASLREAQAAIRHFGTRTGSSTHPDREARLEAIANGWSRGSNDRPNPPPPKPAPSVSPQRTSILISYAGDAYGCALPIRIVLGDRRYTPQGRAFQADGVRIGRQNYRIDGTISCPYIGRCQVQGTGTINVTQGGAYHFQWQNVGYGQCNAWLR
jgi:hypothetical protein